MGATGHIAIYSYSKFMDQFDEEIIDSFMAHFTSFKMYIQSLEGKYYITRYGGDNFRSGISDLYDVVDQCYNVETDSFNKESRAYEELAAKYFMKLLNRQAFYEMTQFLEKECRLTSWEVWT